MKRAAKAQRLRAQIEDEYLEVEHLYKLLKTTIEPEPHTGAASYKVEAMKLLHMAMSALEEAGTYVDGIT